jgi:hypothetical protein
MASSRIARPKKKSFKETKGEAKPDETDLAKPEETPPDLTSKETSAKDPPTEVAAEPPPTPPEPAETSTTAEETGPPATKTTTADASKDVSGAEEQQNAQTIRANEDTEINRLRDYAG